MAGTVHGHPRHTRPPRAVYWRLKRLYGCGRTASAGCVAPNVPGGYGAGLYLQSVSAQPVPGGIHVGLLRDNQRPTPRPSWWCGRARWITPFPTTRRCGVIIIIRNTLLLAQRQRRASRAACLPLELFEPVQTCTSVMTRFAPDVLQVCQELLRRGAMAATNVFTSAELEILTTSRLRHPCHHQSAHCLGS